MKNSLKTLSRIEKFNINEQRKILVFLQEQQDKIKLALDNLNLQYEQEKQFQRQNQMIGDFGAYTKRYLTQKEEFENQITELENQISNVRDKISDMYKEQKTYEIIDENRTKQEEKELTEKEQKLLDEIGTNTYIKHHKQ